MRADLVASRHMCNGIRIFGVNQRCLWIGIKKTTRHQKTGREKISFNFLDKNALFTRVNNKRAEVAVVNGPNEKYVRTHADGYYNDNLLALMECVGA